MFLDYLDRSTALLLINPDNFSFFRPSAASLR